MIVASIHDPEVFAPKRFEEYSGYLGTILERLRIMQRGHLFVVDDSSGGSVIAKRMLSNFAQNTSLQMIASALIQPTRCIRLPIDPKRHKKISQWIDSPGSAEAVALAGHGGVDVCVVSQDTYDAVEAESISVDCITTLDNYHSTTAFEKEGVGFGGNPISELSQEEFLERIIRPLVHWASSLTIIDKMIGRSAFGDRNDPSGSPSPNWHFFNDTLKSIFDQWDAGPFSSRNRLKIITEHVTHVVKNDHPLLGNEQAAELARQISIPSDRISVVLKDHDKVKELNHDRYLLTNHGFVVGSTRGFDLLAGNDQCKVGDVFIRQQHSMSDPVARLANSSRGNAGTYCAS